MCDLLLQHVPGEFCTYVELFCGGGAFFYRLHDEGRLRRFAWPPRDPKNRVLLEDTDDAGLDRARGPSAFLCDGNVELMTTYKVVRDDPEGLLDALLTFYRTAAGRISPFYGWLRDRMEPANDVETAARMLFLNKHCFNGLYRVNADGRFNVPFAADSENRRPDPAKILASSQALQRVQLHPGYFLDGVIAGIPRRGDLVYADPPYDGTFDQYVSKKTMPFGDAERVHLRDHLTRFVENGVHVLLSEADTPRVRELYSKRPFVLHTVETTQTVSCTAEGRKKRADLIVVGKLR